MSSMQPICRRGRILTIRWLKSHRWKPVALLAVSIVGVLFAWYLGPPNYLLELSYRLRILQSPTAKTNTASNAQQLLRRRPPTESERIANSGRRREESLLGRAYADESHGYRFIRFIYKFQKSVSALAARVKRSLIDAISYIEKWDFNFHLVKWLPYSGDEPLDEAAEITPIPHVIIIEPKFEQRMQRDRTIDSYALLKFENVASLHKGASVIAEFSSSLPQSNFFYYIFGVDSRNKNSYEALLKERDSYRRSDAFCFRCNSGAATIHLSRPARLVALEYEHLHWYGNMRRSAPRTFDILRCSANGSECDEEKPLAHCEYFENGGVRQICYPHEHSSNSTSVHTIRLQVTSNYGARWTCLYSLSVLASYP